MGYGLRNPGRAPGHDECGQHDMNAENASVVQECEAHDLLRLSALPSAQDRPAWLAAAFADAPFAVARRAVAPQGFVAVGFRGPSRSDRYGALVARDSVVSVTPPEALIHRCPSPGRAVLKAFAALRRIVEQRGLESLVWGPTGSVGFELATAHPAVTETSDLDVLIRAPLPLIRAHAHALRGRLAHVERELGLRIDAQLETPAGGIALNEWIEGKPRVLARSASGPSLVDDPWANAVFS